MLIFLIPALCGMDGKIGATSTATVEITLIVPPIVWVVIDPITGVPSLKANFDLKEMTIQETEIVTRAKTSGRSGTFYNSVAGVRQPKSTAPVLIKTKMYMITLN